MSFFDSRADLSTAGGFDPPDQPGRWATFGGAAIAALVLGLSVALAIAAGDDGPDGPPGIQFSAPGVQGYGVGPGFAPGGAPPLPEGAPVPEGVPQAPEGYPPSGGYPAPDQAPQSQGGQGFGQG